MLYESIVVFMLGVGGVAAHIPTFTGTVTICLTFLLPSTDIFCTAIATTATAIPAVKLDHPDIKQFRKKANVVTAVEAGKPANEQSWKKGDHVIYMEVFKPTTTLSTFTGK